MKSRGDLTNPQEKREAPCSYSTVSYEQPELLWVLVSKERSKNWCFLNTKRQLCGVLHRNELVWVGSGILDS